MPPFTAVALWLSSLALRAFACLLAAISLVFFLPGTGLFVTLTHWCAHVAVPASESPLAVEGHGIAQVALYAPCAVLGASLAWMCVASVRDARAARHVIADHAVGLGPRDSLIVGGSDVLFAAAGLVHPRIMVSAGALTALDDDELAAGLNHEAGHIARRHRFVMLLAVGLRRSAVRYRAAAGPSASSRSISSATQIAGRCARRTTAPRWRASSARPPGRTGRHRRPSPGSAARMFLNAWARSLARVPAPRGAFVRCAPPWRRGW